MQLQYIYKSDINRDINGVIKVAQNDEKSIEQELREYIITRELRKHFNTFFNNYEKSLNYRNGNSFLQRTSDSNAFYD